MKAVLKALESETDAEIVAKLAKHPLTREGWQGPEL